MTTLLYYCLNKKIAFPQKRSKDNFLKSPVNAQFLILYYFDTAKFNIFIFYAKSI